MRLLVSADARGVPATDHDAGRAQYLREFIEHPAGTFGTPQREKAESCLNGLLSALSAARTRAELAERALRWFKDYPEWIPAPEYLDRVCEDIAAWRSRAAVAPDPTQETQ